MLAIVVRALVLAVLASGCGAASGRPSDSTAAPSDSAARSGLATSRPGGARELTILAAASLKSVLGEAEAAYEAANPGTRLIIATDSSAAIEAQIEQGAYADVFLSADTTNPQKLVDAGLADGDPVVIARSELAIVVPTDNPAAIDSWQDLAGGGVKVIAAGDDVPITTYANQLVANLAALPGAPAGFAAGYAENIVSREENVKALMAKIELGEGDAGIVYATDATASTRVTTVDVPADANVPATYAGVVVKASDDIQRAEGFLDWFAGPDGQAILAADGFLPPPP